MQRRARGSRRPSTVAPYKTQRVSLADRERQFRDERDAALEFYAIKIQAAWRGYADRKKLPMFLAAMYATYLMRLLYKIWSPRCTAKALIAAQNYKVRTLRTQNPIAHFFGYNEVDRHLNCDHQRTRGALLLQSWWRGCHSRGLPLRQPWPPGTTCRGISRHSGRPDELQSRSPCPRTNVDDFAAFLDVGAPTNKTMAYREEEPRGHALATQDFEGTASSLTDILPSFATITNKLWQVQTDIYPGTKVKKIFVPDIRALHMPRRVTIFYSDTGGGHRASAIALEAALHRLYGDQVSVTLEDFIRGAMPLPWSLAPEGYHVVGQYPSLYKKIYEVEGGHSNWSDTKTFQMLWYLSRESILAYMTERVKTGIDLVISVHPLINHLVIEAFQEIFARRQERLPLVTVVTDLGSAHLSWFEPRVDMLFVPNEVLERKALEHGVPQRRIHVCGLPIRQGFWQADQRTQGELRALLNLVQLEGSKVVLVMSGGEGFGNFLEVAIAIGERLAVQGRGQMVVICGRNDEVREQLEQQWCDAPARAPGAGGHVILGFVNNVDEYMGAADCLVTKAGPGSIAEAMVKGLPCLLTSFVPGQEEGNVDFVVDGGAGQYVPDTDPEKVADVVESWLGDARQLSCMSACASRLARPQATLDIARRIYDKLLLLGTELEEPMRSRCSDSETQE